MAPSAQFTAPSPAPTHGTGGVVTPSLSAALTSSASPIESSAAVELVQKVTALADRLLARPTEQVSVRIDLDDTRHVEVRVALQNGKVRADFETNSPALRTALADAWQDFAQKTPGTDRRWAEPSFTATASSSISGSAASSIPAPTTTVSPVGTADAATAFHSDQGSSRRDPPARFNDVHPTPSGLRAPSASLVADAPLATPSRRAESSRHLDLFA